MKYLLLDIKKPARNIEHALNILRAAIREAMYLNRTLIVGTFTISADGNLGYTLKNTSFKHYVNLDKIQICRLKDGDITQLDKLFHYINAENFNLGAYRENSLSGFPIIYGNSSPHHPWRYKFLAWYKSLIGVLLGTRFK